MKIEEFIELFQEELEIESIAVNINTKFSEIEEFDSISIMTLVAVIDEHFGMKITGKDFGNINSVSELIEFIGKEKFD